jgi:hypothetical protein
MFQHAGWAAHWALVMIGAIDGAMTIAAAARVLACDYGLEAS